MSDAHDAFYLLRVPISNNVRRDIGSTPLVVNDDTSLPYDGYRNPETGGQDSNIDLDDDDMSRLQDLKPLSVDFDYDQDRESIRYNMHPEDNRLQELDYYEQLDLAPQSRHPDRYGWEQYHRGTYYN